MDQDPNPLSVIIPAYNERDTIVETLNRVLSTPGVREVIVIDDGSDDGTAALLDGLGDPRLRVFHQLGRQGKGSAIRRAIPLVEGDIAVIQDADMEYDPHELPRLVQIIRDGASVVYGSRFLGRITGMRVINRLGNRLLTLVTNLLYGARLTDEATCYKMFRSDILKSTPLQCNRFEFCPEVTAKLLRRGVAIVETPINYHGRPHSAGKKIRWWDFVEAVSTLFRYRFHD